MREKNIPLDNYHYHEILDRLAVFVDMINAYALKHPVSKQHPQLSELIDQGLSTLMDAYQVVAKLSDTRSDLETEKIQHYFNNTFKDSTFSQIPPTFTESIRTDDLNI